MIENKEIWKNKLAILDKRIESFSSGYRQNIALLGGDEEETSYLLGIYLQSNKLKEVIYIHTTTTYINPRDFFKTVIFSLLSEYLNIETTLDNLINQAGINLKTTANFIKDTLKKQSYTFLDILETINKFINESKKQCIFIIEEFSALENLFANHFKDFSKFLILQRNCMVILTDSHTKKAEKILASELNLLFGNFEKIYLDDTSFLENYVYIKNQLSPYNFSPLFLSFFVNILGNNTLYYNSISNFIKNNYIQNNDESTIISTLKNALYSQETYFFQKFSKKILLLKERFKNFHEIIKILIYISDGYLRRKELNSLHICDTKELKINLSKLTELNYIINYGNVYNITDPLFSFWLSYTFKLYVSPCILNPSKRMILWEKKVIEGIALFKEDFLKDKIKKIMELFASFKDDTLTIGKIKYKLPTIEKTKIISYPEKGLYFLIGEGKEIVFVGIKEKEAEDNDIFEFLEKGSNIKGRGVHKIFISLDRVNPTAKLVAKNHKLIIWDVNEINHLMQVYNKPIFSLENNFKDAVAANENISNF